MKIPKLVRNLFLKPVRKIFPNGLKISKRNLIFGILILIFCIGAVWTFFIYRANKSIDRWKKSDDWKVTEQAAKSLSKIGKPAAGPLITALKDEDYDIRWRAAKALGEIKDTRAIEPLTEALKDKDRRIRYRAIEALGKIGDARCIKPLSSALKDEDLDIRERAVKALEEVGKPAVEYIFIALRDESWDIKRAALEALIRLTGENFGTDPVEWQKWWNKNKDNFLMQK